MREARCTHLDFETPPAVHTIIQVKCMMPLLAELLLLNNAGVLQQVSVTDASDEIGSNRKTSYCMIFSVANRSVNQNKKNCSMYRFLIEYNKSTIID